MTFVARSIIPWRPLDRTGELRAFEPGTLDADSPFTAIRQAHAATAAARAVGI